MPTLDVELERQINSRWCWLAVTSSMARFYTPMSHWSQAKLMERLIRTPRYGAKVLHLQRTLPKPSTFGQRTNIPGKIEDGLRMVQCFRARVDLLTQGDYQVLADQAHETFMTIVKPEIDAGHPIVAGVRPKGSSGEGHAVIIVGYEDNGTIHWKEPGQPHTTRKSPNFLDFMWNGGDKAYLDYMLLTKSPGSGFDPSLVYRHNG